MIRVLDDCKPICKMQQLAALRWRFDGRKSSCDLADGHSENQTDSGGREGVGNVVFAVKLECHPGTFAGMRKSKSSFSKSLKDNILSTNIGARFNAEGNCTSSTQFPDRGDTLIVRIQYGSTAGLHTFHKLGLGVGDVFDRTQIFDVNGQHV